VKRRPLRAYIVSRASSSPRHDVMTSPKRLACSMWAYSSSRASEYHQPWTSKESARLVSAERSYDHQMMSGIQSTKEILVACQTLRSRACLLRCTYGFEDIEVHSLPSAGRRTHLYSRRDIYIHCRSVERRFSCP
jgi:hypothetical protein